MKRLIFFVSLAFLAISSFAEKTTAFSDLVSEIVSNNTSASVSERTINSEISALSSANNLSDPEAEFSHQWGQEGIGNKWSVGVSQSFEWPGVYASRKNQISAEKLALGQVHLENIRQIRLEIRSTLIEVVYYKQLIQLAKSQVERIDSLYSIYLKGADLGEISKLDINKLKIERINISRELFDAENSLKECCDKLAELNGGKNCDAIIAKVNEFPSEELLPMQHYKTAALQNDPTRAYRTHMTDAARYEMQALKRSSIPGFSIGYNHDYELGEHFNGISIGVTLPIFSNRHKKSAIESRQLVLQAEQFDVENKIASVIELSYNQVLSLDREKSLYDSVLKGSDNIRLLDIALKSGHITLVEYLLEINFFMDAHKQMLEVSRQRAKRMSELTQWSES